MPTVRQARSLASAYRVPFATFYLEAPPQTKARLPKDYRRFAGTMLGEVSPEILLDVRNAWEKREIALELLHAQGMELPRFDVSVNLSEDPDVAGGTVREALKITLEQQSQWRDARRALNAWRLAVESHGVLVLQTSDVPLAELRAYSLFAEPLPVIVLNRKDVPAARVFSLHHEFVHLALHSEGLCDLTTEVDRTPEEQRLEVFCNATAAACLMPQAAVLGHPLVKRHTAGPVWDDNEIVQLSREFSTSREALLRRLLTLGLTTEAFYKTKRAQYRDEYEAHPARGGFTSPPTDALSLLGRPFVRLVLTGLDAGAITTSDASDYLGLRLKHIPALVASLEGEPT
jgi:Zn-dependent peptidase ImmA (M78 family)